MSRLPCSAHLPYAFPSPKQVRVALSVQLHFMPLTTLLPVSRVHAVHLPCRTTGGRRPQRGPGGHLPPVAVDVVRAPLLHDLSRYRRGHCPQQGEAYNVVAFELGFYGGPFSPGLRFLAHLAHTSGMQRAGAVT